MLHSGLNVILVTSVLVPAVVRRPRVERYGLLVDARATPEHEAVEDLSAIGRLALLDKSWSVTSTSPGF